MPEFFRNFSKNLLSPFGDARHKWVIYDIFAIAYNKVEVRVSFIPQSKSEIHIYQILVGPGFLLYHKTDVFITPLFCSSWTQMPNIRKCRALTISVYWKSENDDIIIIVRWPRDFRKRQSTRSHILPMQVGWYSEKLEVVYRKYFTLVYIFLRQRIWLWQHLKATYSGWNQSKFATNCQIWWENSISNFDSTSSTQKENWVS